MYTFLGGLQVYVQVSYSLLLWTDAKKPSQQIYDADYWDVSSSWKEIKVYFWKGAILQEPRWKGLAMHRGSIPSNIQNRINAYSHVMS